MITDNQKVFYNRFKSELVLKYKSPFNPIITSKSQSADFIILGINKDIIYKFVRPGDRFRVPKWVDYWKNTCIWSKHKRELILVFVDSDYTYIIKEEIIELN